MPESLLKILKKIINNFRKGIPLWKKLPEIYVFDRYFKVVGWYKM